MDQTVLRVPSFTDVWPHCPGVLGAAAQKQRHPHTSILAVIWPPTSSPAHFRHDFPFEGVERVGVLGIALCAVRVESVVRKGRRLLPFKVRAKAALGWESLPDAGVVTYHSLNLFSALLMLW